MKKTKLFIAIVLMVQAVSCLIAFLFLRKKHGGLSKALLAASAIGAAAGSIMMFLHAKERLDYRKKLLGKDGHDFADDYDEFVDLDEISSYDDADDLCAEDGVDEIPF